MIQYERVTPFNNYVPPMITARKIPKYFKRYNAVDVRQSTAESKIPVISIEDIRNNIISLVDKLHSLGYGHGDLHIGNIGFKERNIYLLDHDTIYKIENGHVPWLSKWMEIGFEWIESFEAFVDNDYDTWNGDWLSD